MPETFTIVKRNNNPVILARPIFMEYFKGFPEETQFKVEFRRIGANRSNQQNRYYWGVIVEAFRYGVQQQWGDYIGKQEAHETLKSNCLYTERINEDTGEVLRIIGSTSENDTGEQEVYHEKCRRLIMDYFGIEVPLPVEGQLEIF
jgi:hypothetical protein